MREETKRWHTDVLAEHNHRMFESLIYPEHIISENLKEVEFDEEILRGYFARKDKDKYWLNEKYKDPANKTHNVLQMLPIRVGSTEVLKNKEDVVLKVKEPAMFRITPQHSVPIRQFIDDFVPFKHSNVLHWNMMKFIAIMSFVGKTFICIASPSNFGKTNLFDVMHDLTDKCPVFKPRSVPGVLNKINITGNMVMDEAQDCKKEVKDIMEEFALAIGGGKTTYINGAMKSANTKNKYLCTNQSITFLYNNIENYKDPDKAYFEVIFSNNTAIDNRFLKLKFDGILTELFDKAFNIPQEAEDNRPFYIQFAKELEYLAKVKRENSYVRRWKDSGSSKLRGRRKVVFDEITWLIDAYCISQEEYDVYITALDDSIQDYKEMVSGITGESSMVTEERIE